MKNTCGHENKPYYGNDMCDTCYWAWYDSLTPRQLNAFFRESPNPNISDDTDCIYEAPKNGPEWERTKGK